MVGKTEQKRKVEGGRQKGVKPVTIVLLNYNKPDITIRCIEALKKQTYKNFSIVLIDNGSKDDSIKKLEGYVKNKKGSLRVSFFKEKKNTGFDAGINLGVRKAKTDYIISLDNDAVVVEDWIEKLVEKLESDSRLAFVGSQFMQHGDVYVKRLEKRFVINFLGELIPTEHQDVGFTFFAPAGAMIFRKSIVGEPFDPEFFVLFEDVYASGKALLKGYKVEMTDVIMDHIGGLTRKGANDLWEYYGERNRLYCLMLLYSGKTLLKISPLLAIQVILTLISSTIKLRVHIRLKSYLWFLRNWGRLVSHRREIQGQRVKTDQVLFDHMTYKIRYQLPVLTPIVNAFMWLYCFLFRIKVYDL